MPTYLSETVRTLNERMNLESSAHGGRKYTKAEGVYAKTVPTAQQKVAQGGSGKSSNLRNG